MKYGGTVLLLKYIRINCIKFRWNKKNLINLKALMTNLVQIKLLILSFTYKQSQNFAAFIISVFSAFIHSKTYIKVNFI